MICLLHVAICDDEETFVQHLNALLTRYAQETGIALKISTYRDGADLVDPYDASLDLIFLDIQMCAMDGLRAAEQIRKLDSKVAIIFLTTLTQYGLEAEMDKFLARRQTEPDPFLLIVNDTGKYKVFLRDLRYIETFNRNLLCHTEQENILSYKSMKEMESTLQGQGFARCHTSYLVNLFFVKGVKKLEITLVTGETIPISQPKRKEFMERLTEYWGDLL